MFTWILANLNLVKYGLIALAVSILLLTVNHWRMKAAELDAAKAELSKVQDELKQQSEKVEKVHYVRIKVASLPVGAASSELFQKWSRSTH